jgi:hypothetical protein
MRILYAVPLLLLAGCQVTEDEANNQTTLAFNEELAQNTAEDVANAAGNAGEAIANGAEDLANRAENVDVDVDTNTADKNKTTN